MNEPIRIEIYTRPGCHLCDEAKAVIQTVQDRHRLDVRVINIEDDPHLEAAYGMDIPVVFINGKKVEFSPQPEDGLRVEIETALGAKAH